MTIVRTIALSSWLWSWLSMRLLVLGEWNLILIRNFIPFFVLVIFLVNEQTSLGWFQQWKCGIVGGRTTTGTGGSHIRFGIRMGTTGTGSSMVFEKSK